jgi:hypothetical protein
MIVDLTMIATLPVDQNAVERVIVEEDEAGVVAQQPEPPHADPGPPKSPEQPVVPPDDPHRKDIDREPSIDPPPTEPPVQAPSEKPGITEPPRPRA